MNERIDVVNTGDGVLPKWPKPPNPDPASMVMRIPARPPVADHATTVLAAAVPVLELAWVPWLQQRHAAHAADARAAVITSLCGARIPREEVVREHPDDPQRPECSECLARWRRIRKPGQRRCRPEPVAPD